MRVLELIHDKDQPPITNVDLWIKENQWKEPIKVLAYESFSWPDFESFDLIIIHGGSQHLWDKSRDPWLFNELEFISEAVRRRKPMIGFCLGSQIIAEVLGGKVYNASEKEIGWLKVYPRNPKHRIFRELEEGFTTFLWHSDHYGLPPGCISLAYTEAAPHQIIVSEAAPVAGFQFHPEYTKQSIRSDYHNCAEEHWKGGRFVVKKEGFLKDLQQRPETYPLFEKLMSNTIGMFYEKFGVLKD